MSFYCRACEMSLCCVGNISQVQLYSGINMSRGDPGFGHKLHLGTTGSPPPPPGNAFRELFNQDQVSGRHFFMFDQSWFDF